MGSFLRDLQYAVRALLRRPAFTVVAVGSLGLGIAVNATIFSWVDRILLNPMAGVPDGRQLVTIKTVAANGDLLDSSYLDFRDFREQAKTLSGVIAFKQRPLYLGDAPNAERVWSEMVSGNFFDVLKVKPMLGRTFSAEEQAERPGGAPVEAGIPEDDPRNPAVIADLVGDNVGDCAGRGADIFESTAAENVGAMILGAALYPVFGVKGILFPLIVLAINLIASIVGVFVVKHDRKMKTRCMR